MMVGRVELPLPLPPLPAAEVEEEEEGCVDSDASLPTACVLLVLVVGMAGINISKSRGDN